MWPKSGVWGHKKFDGKNCSTVFNLLIRYPCIVYVLAGRFSWPLVSDTVASSPLKASAIHHCYRKSMMSSVTTLEIWQSRCSSHTSMLFSEPQIFETLHLWFKFPAFSCHSWPLVSGDVAWSTFKASDMQHHCRKSMMSSVSFYPTLQCFFQNPRFFRLCIKEFNILLFHTFLGL